MSHFDPTFSIPAKGLARANRNRNLSFVPGGSVMSISYEESEPSNRRDNDTEHKKFLAIRSKQSEDLGRVSYVEHVSESQGKNQYSAIQPCLEDALNQGASYALRSTIYRMQPPWLRWYSPTRPLQLRVCQQLRTDDTRQKSHTLSRPQQQQKPIEDDAQKPKSKYSLPSGQHISRKEPGAPPGFASFQARGLGVFQAASAKTGRRSVPSRPRSCHSEPRPSPNVHTERFFDLPYVSDMQPCR